MSTELSWAKRTVNDLENRQWKGYKDHARHILECSACGVPLVEIMVVEPEFDFEMDYRADCPHCGDHSNAMKVRGQIYIGATEMTLFTGHRQPKGGEPDGIAYLTTAKARKG